ncbi:MAG TPA: hypothetical protein VGD45_15885 [Steroidobacter sp.]|uniref:hypothetical protein n=1 Tax=Steroidobacter sp. TaxID=1978227 RepID=UPI002ED8C6C8
MNAPAWLAFIAIVWWAALFNPAQSQQRFVSGLLDGVDVPSALISLDRQPSLQTNDRRRAEPTRDGNPPALAIPAARLSNLAAISVQPLVAFTPSPAAQPDRSPAQPRAPPVSAHAD